MKKKNYFGYKANFIYRGRDHDFRLSQSVLRLSPLSMLSCDVDREVSSSRYDLNLQ